MINRQLFVRKFMSSRLKKFNYNLVYSDKELSDYYDSLINNETIQLSDNQILRTIRDVVTEMGTTNKHRIFDRQRIEEIYKTIDKIGRKKHSEENVVKVNELKKELIHMRYIPEYIVIVIEHNKHYDELYCDGLTINGIKYKRLSSSAGQSRASTVVFCNENILEEVNERLDNGRDKNVKFSPSKFNAYKGVYGSGTKEVSEPNFTVVNDYFTEDKFEQSFVTETDIGEDDIINVREIVKEFNRADGMGIISPTLAEKWSKEMDLDYIPACFCIRASFIKGMVCVVDFHEWIKEKINKKEIKSSIVKDIYGKEVDLLEVELLLTESQFKLIGSYKSLEQYKSNCIINNLKWGVSLQSPKECKDTLKLNYQFLQTLDIKEEDVPKICERFVKWTNGVNGCEEKDIWYTLLYLMGIKCTEDNIKVFLKHSDSYWIKSLVINHELIYDKYIRDKIFKMIRKKIDMACMGDIICRGNFQTIVSDPIGLLEATVGLEPKGLLNKGEFYSHYWNTKDINKVDSMRAPLTYRSEHVVLNLVNRDEHKKWYEYITEGIIVNIHGHETDNWAGSDFDFDIIATTPDTVDYVYEGELPITYNPPKPEKIIFTEDDLFKSDKFSFGSIIGQITNKSSIGQCLLDELKINYGIESKEYQTTLKRVKMCTKLQSSQIDKVKIGKEVKGIPKKWYDRNYIDSKDNGMTDEEREFNKRILLDRHPYFFLYLYKDTKKKYDNYNKEYDLSCQYKYGITLKELFQKDNKTKEEQEYIDYYNKYIPVIDNKSVMNNICHYIESVKFNIKDSIKNSCDNTKIAPLLMRNNEILNDDIFNKVESEYKRFNKEITDKGGMKEYNNYLKSKCEDDNNMSNLYSLFIKSMDSICSNKSELVDYLINIFYVKYSNANKDLLWNTYGKQIFENLLDKNKEDILFPFPSETGDIEYLEKKFELRKVEI